ncbi:MAG: Smr/MutS family protein [Firmicutes bacterium]|nr:Smr/MutS family protein [Bacillota bacterium]
MRVINIKQDNPNADYALYLIDQEIKYSQAIGNRVIVVIHGYGSHGMGGVIKNEVKKYLPHLKKEKIISDFVFGENWGDLNPTKQLIEKIDPETILNQNLFQINSGVSVILL